MVPIQISIDDIDLNRCETDSVYDFLNIYNQTLDDDELIESPLSYIKECGYHDVNNFTASVNELVNPFSLFCINCQSLNSHIESLRYLMADISNEKFQFDIIGVTETFRIHEDFNYGLNGYHPLISKTRADDDDSHGGVGLYIKEHLSYSLRSDLSVFIPHVIETLFVEVNLNKTKKVILGVIYRPNTAPRADIDVFLQTISELNSIISSGNIPAVMMGDFNVDVLKYETNLKTMDFVDDIISHSCIPLISKPTRVTNHCATLIDNFFSNWYGPRVTSGIVLTDLSDHFGIFTIFENFQNKNKPQTVTYRQYNENNVLNFKNILRECDFSKIMDENDPEKAYSDFMLIYKAKFEEAFPLKTTKKYSKYVKKAPWMTRGILNSTLTKNKLFKIKLRKPTLVSIDRYKT